ADACSVSRARRTPAGLCPAAGRRRPAARRGRRAGNAHPCLEERRSAQSGDRFGTPLAGDGRPAHRHRRPPQPAGPAAGGRSVAAGGHPRGGRDRQGAVADDVVGRTRRPDPCPPGGARRDVLQGTYGQRGGRNARDTQRYGALQGVLRPAVDEAGTGGAGGDGVMSVYGGNQGFGAGGTGMSAPMEGSPVPNEHETVGAYALGILDDAAGLDPMLAAFGDLPGSGSPSIGESLSAKPSPRVVEKLVAEVAERRARKRRRTFYLVAAAGALIVRGPFVAVAANSGGGDGGGDTNRTLAANPAK